MRRFSQRNSLVTLSDINITPLLDLAFVLLIIFVIISPSIRSTHQQGMELNLPQSGGSARPLQANDIQTVEVSPRGIFMLNGRPMNLDQIERALVQAYRANPQLVVSLRVDENGPNKFTFSVIDRCLRNGIDRINMATEPASNR
ncbi:MAG: biopolymer transporter ExbD [Verrucomicrobiota bacterium]